MTQEEKQLLTDLSARLVYGVKCLDSRYGDSVITSIDIEDKTVYCFDFDEWVNINDVILYLRPMSSMTEEEKKSFDGTFLPNGHVVASDFGFDYLNSIHVDYRCLIPKGLALEAPDGMYN